MKDKEKALLRQASEEIKGLRQQNQLLNARLSGFEDALLLLRTPPYYPPQGMAEDLTYIIDKHIVSLEEEEKDSRQAIVKPVIKSHQD